MTSNARTPKIKCNNANKMLIHLPKRTLTHQCLKNLINTNQSLYLKLMKLKKEIDKLKVLWIRKQDQQLIL